MSEHLLWVLGERQASAALSVHLLSLREPLYREQMRINRGVVALADPGN